MDSQSLLDVQGILMILNLLISIMTTIGVGVVINLVSVKNSSIS